MMVEDERYRERNMSGRASDARPRLSVSPGGLCATGGTRAPAKAVMHGEFRIAGEDRPCPAGEGIV